MDNPKPDGSVWHTMDDRNYHFWWQLQLYDILSALISNECFSVWEGACGSASLIKNLRNSGWRGKYLGTDYSEGLLDQAKNNCPDEEFIFANLLSPIQQKDNSFECSIIIDGLECVYPYELALRELKRISSKYVIIVSWVDFIDNEKIRFTKEFKYGVNTYSRKNWDNIIEKVGLKLFHEIVSEEFHCHLNRMIFHRIMVYKV